MSKLMNEFFPLIPQRSFDAYVRERTLQELLCALIVDPDEALDMAEQRGVARTPHSLEDFRLAGGSKGVDAALETAARWAATNRSIWLSSPQLPIWDRHVAAWCAISVTRDILRYTEDDGASLRDAHALAVDWFYRGASDREVALFEFRLRSERFGAITSNMIKSAMICMLHVCVGSDDSWLTRGEMKHSPKMASSNMQAMIYWTGQAAATKSPEYESYDRLAEEARTALILAERYPRSRVLNNEAYRIEQLSNEAKSAYDRRCDSEISALAEVIAEACLTFPR